MANYSPICSQAGGLAVVKKYGSAYFSSLGKKGGRPRALTIEGLRSVSASPAVSKIKVRGGRPGGRAG
jgi:hypothetical protein